MAQRLEPLEGEQQLRQLYMDVEELVLILEFVILLTILVGGRNQFGYSQVSLNDLNIGNATYSTANCSVQTKKIEFDFQDGDTLKLMVSGSSRLLSQTFLRFNSFEDVLR